VQVTQPLYNRKYTLRPLTIMKRIKEKSKKKRKPQKGYKPHKKIDKNRPKAGRLK